jgi:hypothetical protein
MVAKKIFSAEIIFMNLLLTSFLCAWSPDDLVADKETAEKLMRGKIITQTIRLPNSNTYECRAVGVVYAPIERVWKVLCDYNRFKEFMPNFSESFLVHPDAIQRILNKEINDWPKFEKFLLKSKIEKTENDVLYFYNRLNLPWPLKDRYYILKMVQNSENYNFRWTQFIGNTKVNDGSWELIPFRGSKRKTLAIYTLITDPGISFSPALTRLAIKITLPGTVKSVKKRVLELILEERKNERTQSVGNF